MSNNYKDLILLVYFNTVKASYSYMEIGNNFGFDKQQILLVIERFQSEGLLIFDKHYKLSEKSIELLKEHGLYEINYYDSFEITSVIGNKQMDLDEVYVPVGFMKKIK
ncbi:hypothetical protein MKX40_30520 [Paenibacillus sp. FSL R5-0517]|uniref:hypothetical protein n=1 Tax=Paenibacillus sp. FSL R5-0517 TaxID=2921647 RepID=UPI0030D7017C